MGSSASVWAVIVAAGRGKRFRSGELKQFAPLAGRPLLLWTLEPFRVHPSVDGISLVVPAEHVERPPAWLARLQAEDVTVAAGGDERIDSVRLGLATVPRDVRLVAVHDGVRPLVTEAMISRVLERAGPERGAIAGRRVTDSLKQADGAGRVLRSVSRENLWRAETPQIFPRELIVDLHRRAQVDGFKASDSAALCERYGVEVVLVEISELNPKVTGPEDLPLVEAWIRQRGQLFDP
jgi:2-C-methyl-D-erythritol 4-phosphate cytidylyltransferase